MTCICETKRRSAHLAIIARQRGATEYEVYSYKALQHGIEPGDTLLVRDVDDPRLPGFAHVLNLTWGVSKIVSWDDLAHAIKPR